MHAVCKGGLITNGATSWRLVAERSSVWGGTSKSVGKFHYISELKMVVTTLRRTLCTESGVLSVVYCKSTKFSVRLILAFLAFLLGSLN